MTHTAILITNAFFRWLAYLSLISEALISFLGGRLVSELLLDELQNFHTLCRNSTVYHITFVTHNFFFYLVLDFLNCTTFWETLKQ